MFRITPKQKDLNTRMFLLLADHYSLCVQTDEGVWSSHNNSAPTDSSVHLRCGVTRLKDTDDAAAQGPDSDAEADHVDGAAVDVRLHVEWKQRLNQDVESPDPKGHHRPHQVHGEQRRLLRWHTHTHSLPTCSALYMHELFQDRQHSPGSWPPRTSRRSWLNPAAARCGSVGGVWAQSHLSEPPPACTARTLWAYLRTQGDAINFSLLGQNIYGLNKKLNKYKPWMRMNLNKFTKWQIQSLWPTITKYLFHFYI